ncbi:biotin--[acetyl-CoA-carboxylase] ligase [Flavobacterium orientale]|uniref:Biotin--[acetyl-CoA-carboxylase] ligase n=1 Tax=Flavobacterium orientale TaxID=1756020 RepID=A0A917DF58_9FLAO|nr:biotin--[acetyl-CoA-carboxylase] ligase [Flavobacterium orientale]GGD32829.1 biotin--[acetyl-CoA-carboxylase] ligase [Flavobacterium orientale]
MNLIKLNATTSTNDFLKQLYASQVVDNFTVVTAFQQTSGKGQMGSKWESEAGKNLTMSILVKDVLVDAQQIFHLNVAVTLAVAMALKEFKINDVQIKWPNDIMSGNFKIGGILIENNFKSDGEIVSFVGIGLNINQLQFDQLPKASSLQIQMKKAYDIDSIRDEIVHQLRMTVAKIIHNQAEVLWESYHSHLFKKDKPMPFEDMKGQRFMGVIQHVNNEGRLEVRLEDDSMVRFGVKEVRLLY